MTENRINLCTKAGCRAACCHDFTAVETASRVVGFITATGINPSLWVSPPEFQRLQEPDRATKRPPGIVCSIIHPPSGPKILVRVNGPCPAIGPDSGCLIEDDKFQVCQNTPFNPPDCIRTHTNR